MPNVMLSKGFVFSALFAALTLLGGVFWYTSRNGQEAAVNSFDECVARGYPILESYPLQCRTPNGSTFTEDIGNELEKQDQIRLERPRPLQVVESPLQITGEARGSWFFEASFPARLVDGNGNSIASVSMQAQGEWMTKDFVKFEGTIAFQKPKSEKGTLILEKDNPSDLPENAEQLRVPVRYSE